MSNVLVMEGGEGDTFGDCESGRPLIAENIETDTSVGVDVWMIDSCCEVDLKEPRVSIILKNRVEREITFGGLKG